MSRCCIANTNYGPMIINHLDSSVGLSIQNTGTHEQDAINFGLNIIQKQLELRGHGVSVLDVGANVGINTVAWAKSMIQDNVIVGTVMAFEPQERVYYMAAGNIALNNLLNARISMSAVSDKTGTVKIPKMDHSVSGSFGGFSLVKERMDLYTEQKISFEEQDMVDVRSVALDDFEGRVDFIKIDVEGWEPNVLDGSQKLLARERPVILAEYIICGTTPIMKRLKGYRTLLVGANICAFPEEETEMIDFARSIIKHRNFDGTTGKFHD